MRNKRLAWLALLSALVLAVFAIGLRNNEVDTSVNGPVGAPMRADEPQRDARAPALPPLDTTRPPRALPRPGTVDELAAQAGSGNAVAACQLAAELSACRSNEVLRRHDPDATAYAATTRCEQLLGAHAERHFDWLRQAAHAGEPEAMLRYAMGEGFGISGAGFDYLRSPRFDTWRREAPAMLESLLQAGYPEAAIYRMVASDPLLGGPMGNLLPSDPEQDLAYTELFLLFNDDADLTAMLRRQQPRANAVMAENARQQAAHWHQERYGAQTFDFSAMDGGDAFPVMRAHGQTCSVALDGDKP